MDKDLRNAKISVIVTIYNIEEYLRECLDSILNQTYKNLEIILVNDGSTDSSGKICEEYAERDARIKIVNKSNSGLCDARNWGLEAATGDLIAFVDGDDYILPDMYQILLDNLIDFQVDMSICSYEFFGEIGIERPKLEKENTKKMSVLEVLSVLHTKDRIDFVVSWNKLFKKELYEGLRYPERNVLDDEPVTYQLHWRAGNVVFTNKRLYFFRQRNDSLTHTPSLRKYTEYLDSLLKRNCFFMNEVKDADLWKRDTLFCMEELCNIHFRKDCPKEKLVYYHKQYVQMYKVCELKKQLPMAKRLKYFAAARMSGILRGVWKIKKLKG